MSINIYKKKLFIFTFLIITSFAYSLNTAIASQNDTQDKQLEAVIKKENKTVNKQECTTSEIDLSQGKLCGRTVNLPGKKTANTYLGIPFGETTAGINRWRSPIADSGWNGTFKATEHGPACPQTNRFDPTLPYSEDCLTVNVWTPSEKSKQPRSVMVYIYGGAFLYGYSGDPVYDGAYTAANGDVVVVSMNYRVASLGFLAGIKDKNSGEEINGNFGIMDQALALKWVKDNISNFGGDPDKITLYGQSAGASSVALHLTGPSNSLFNKAIMQSNPLGIPYKSIKDSKPIAEDFAKNIGCNVDDLECLRSKTAEEVINAEILKGRVLEAALHGIKDFLVWAPVIDGKIVTAHPLKLIKETGIRKPLIIGTNKNEGLTFVGFAMNKIGLKKLSDIEYSLALDVVFRSNRLKNKVLKKYPHQNNDNEKMLGNVLTDYLFTCPSLFLADNSSKKTWVYLFDEVPSFNPLKIINLTVCGDAVCHGFELPFVFHSAGNIGYSFTPEEKMLSVLMVDYWTNFARNTDPDGKDEIWPTYKSRTSNVIFVTPINEIESKKDLKAKCDFWDGIGYDLYTSFWDIF